MPESLKFDEEFQLALLALVLTNKEIVAKVKHLRDLPDVFEDDLSKACVDVVLKFHAEYDNLPSKQQLLFELEKRGHVDVQRAIQAAYNIKVDSPNWYYDKIFDFVYSQTFKANLVKAATALERGQLEKAAGIVHTTSKLSKPTTNVGINLFSEIDSPYTESTQKVPTNIEPIDTAMDGGLSKGELGMVLAPSGVGKSMALCFFGIQAVLKNYKVAHFTYELSGERTRMRYEAGFTAIPINELRLRFDEKCASMHRLAKENDLQNNLYVIEYPTKSCTVPMIEAHLDTLADIDFVPDILIVDYVDLIKWSRHLDKREGLGENTEGLRRIAGERKVPVWTATQTNREAMNRVVFGIETVAEAFEKVMISDVVLAICQTEDEYRANTWRWFVAKNRNNKKGQEIESEYDFGIVNLNLHSEVLSR